jgi:hypothetical protein
LIFYLSQIQGSKRHRMPDPQHWPGTMHFETGLFHVSPVSNQRNLAILQAEALTLPLFLVKKGKFTDNGSSMDAKPCLPDSYHLRYPMFRIRNILVRIRMRILGSGPLTNGPDPALFVIYLQGAKKITFFPDADPGGPKTYGGSGTMTIPELYRIIKN